ncbi:ABC-type dipeptide/oligopeptide/nickel transport system, permease component [Synechococcus sp. PCC 7502]|uniref:ABC transporter permease n=1 Tax=Synechococcus sp. PCC 7502 TaxID=1173263 RepID=UPI00029FFA5F|nr:ABC transporter permease [Synechococcus sp. PCC 7502]AFY72188.1 ABC-type dipeptide/oligopeptide/nickel transport system, permease component [Synechococcus sp. PCC 7502]
MNDNFAYILKRLGQAVLVIFLVSVLSFVMLKLSPGDCFTDVKLNPSTSKEFIESEKARLGYDQPILIQYRNWLGSALQGNLGRTCQGNAPVFQLVSERAGNTLILALASLVTTWAIAIPLGIFCAVKQNTKLDQTIQVVSYIIQGFPSFILAILVLMFAQSTSLFPVGGLTSIDFGDRNWFGQIIDIGYHLVLPVFTLTIIGFVGLQRLMRGNLLDVLRQDYIKTARSKGLPENKVIYVHALRNAINPLITLLGFELSGLLGGSFITEYFFGLPGLGKLLLQAVQQKDVNLVMAGLTLGTLMLVIGNLLADLLLKAVDPRIRLEELD